MRKQTHLIIKATCDNEYADPQPSYAIIRTSVLDLEDLIAKIERVKQFQDEEDGDVYQISFWDGSPTWVSLLPWEIADGQDEHDACWPTDLITGDSLADLVDAGFEFAMVKIAPQDDELSHAVRVECVTLEADKDSIDWQGYIKHTSDHVGTVSIGIEDLQKILQILSERKTA